MKKILSLVLSLIFAVSCFPLHNTKALENKKAKVCLNYTLECGLNFHSDNGAWDWKYTENPECIMTSYDRVKEMVEQSPEIAKVLDIQPVISLRTTVYQDDAFADNCPNIPNEISLIVKQAREQHGVEIPFISESQLSEHIQDEQFDYCVKVLPDVYNPDLSYCGIVPEKIIDKVKNIGFQHVCYTVNVHEDYFFNMISSVISLEFNGTGDCEVHGLSNCIKTIATLEATKDRSSNMNSSVVIVKADDDEDYSSPLTRSSINIAKANDKKTFSQFVDSSTTIPGVDVDEDYTSALTCSIDNPKLYTCENTTYKGENENKLFYSQPTAKILGGISATGVLAAVVSQVWKHVKSKQSTVL